MPATQPLEVAGLVVVTVNNVIAVCPGFTASCAVVHGRLAPTPGPGTSVLD
jgi:hypothetical protein